MNRLLLPLLLFLSILFPRQSVAQMIVWTSTNNPFNTGSYCYSTTGNTGTAQIVQEIPGTTSHTWIVLPPQGCTVQPTYTCVSCPQSDTIIDVSFACCGQYSIIAVSWNNTISTTPIIQGYDTAFVNIICPNTASATPSKSIICLGETVNIVGNGAATYTWSSSPGGNISLPNTQNPVPVTPTVNSTYTMVGTTASSCIVTATTQILVQSATVTASPPVQSMCLGSPVCFTATAFPAIGPSVTPGTATTGLQWYDPLGTPFSTAFTTCTPAIGGTYSVVLTHTGQAGVCTLTATSLVNITNSITSSASSNTTAACPGQTIQLTATSIQTAAASHTWTTPGGATVVGNPVVVSHTAAGIYTVDIDYFGCPGQATTSVGMATLTPTLTTVGGGSICANTCATLQAYGGNAQPVFNYTFYYFTPPSNTLTQIGTAGTTSMGSIVHCTPQLAATYSVYVEDNRGCSGGGLAFVQEFTMNPQFGTLLANACPSSAVTFTTGNAGPGSNFTIVAPYTPTNVYTGTSDTVVHTLPGIPPYTYTLHVDSGGCRGMDVHTVNLHTFYPVLSASSLSICPNTTFTLSSTGGTAATYTFYSAPGVVIPNSPNTYSVVDTPTSLARTYTVEVDSSNCIGIDSLRIYALDLSPRLWMATAPGQSVCPNTTYTMTASLSAGTSYTFAPPANSSVLSQTNNVATASGSVPATWTVQVDSAGCSGSTLHQMFPFILKPQLSANPDTVCAGMPVQLCATGGSLTTYTFLEPIASFPFVAVVGNSATTSQCVTDNNGPTSPTSYTVVSDSLGCIGVDSVMVHIAPGLTVTASGSNTFICSGSSVTLSASGPTNAVYSWSQITGTNNPVPVPGGTSLNYNAAVQGVVVNPTVTTQYILYAVDAAGCTGTAVVTVSINPSASLAITVSPASATICAPFSTTMAASGAASYTWYPSTGLTPPVTSATVTAQPSVTMVYTVIGTNNLGCYGSATTQVQVGPQPTVNIVPTSFSVCPGYNATLTAFGATSYTWVSNTFTGSVAQQSVAGGQGSYTVVGSNGGSCIHDTVIKIGVQKPLDIKILATPNTATTCIEVNFPYKLSKAVVLNASGAGSYFWQPYDPQAMTYSIGPQTTVRPPATTDYTVTGYTSTCSGTTNITVTVIPQFSMNVTPPLPAICYGDSLKLSIANVSTLAVGPASKFTYSWTDPIPPSITSQNGGVLSPTVMAYPPKTSSYSVEVKDSRGCASLPKLVTVTVFPRPITAVSIPTINNAPTNTVCFVGIHTGPPDVVLDLVATNKNTNLPFGVVPTYTWVSPYPAPYVSILTPPNNPQISIGAPTRTPAVVVYTVLSGYNGVPGCAEIDTVHVRVVDCRPIRSVAPPIFAMADGIDTLCAMECITFIALTDTMAGGPQTYTWSFEGGSPSTSNEKNPRVCYNLPPSNGKGYNVVLNVSNPYPVADGGSEKVVGVASYVKVVDIPNVIIKSPGALKSDTTVRFGTPVNLTASGALAYSWTPNYNISSTTGNNVTVRPFRTTRYVVTGYNSSNCVSRDTVDVIVIEDCGEMFVPNAFSPNGDGHNDVLRVQGICLQSLSFMIFNRWGEKVFETSDQSYGWDGTYKGEPMNTGVFVYRLEGKTYEGKAYSAKGNITLIR